MKKLAMGNAESSDCADGKPLFHRRTISVNFHPGEKLGRTEPLSRVADHECTQAMRLPLVQADAPMSDENR